MHGAKKTSQLELNFEDNSLFGLHYVFDNGGRTEVKGLTSNRRGDCVTRAMVIASGVEYSEILELVRDGIKKSNRKRARRGYSKIDVSGFSGCSHEQGTRIMKSLDWEYWPNPGTMADVPKRGTYVVKMRRHWVTVIDGTVHDTWDSRKSRHNEDKPAEIMGWFEKA